MNAGKLLGVVAGWAWKSVLRPAIERKAVDVVTDIVARKRKRRPREDQLPAPDGRGLKGDER